MARRTAGLGLAALLAVTLWGCEDGSATAVPSGPEEDETLPVTFLAGTREVTDSLTVAIHFDLGDAGDGWGAQGTLRWDPARMTWVGQVPEDGVAVVVNRARVDAGALPFVSLNPARRTPYAGLHVFRLRPGVRVAEAMGSLTADIPVIQDGLGRLRRAAVLPWRPGFTVALPDPAEGRRLDWDDWATVLDPGFQREGPARVPGEGTVYGDANLDGLINVLDGLYVANVSVGNTVIAECILGTDGPSRDCIAANVRPANLPGLGEATDDCPPGFERCDGSSARVINVLDALPISRESVGFQETIVGEPIPVVDPPPDTVELSGTLTGTRILASDTIYRLAGTVTVGSETAGPGELVIRPGTRVVGGSGSILAVSRNGTLDARGRPFQPILFTCDADAPAPGCWGGVVLRGNAVINRGTAVSPVLPGRAEEGGCLQTSDGPGDYGGCNDADGSGALQYVRILWAGEGGRPGLRLHGTGSATLVRQVYLHRSAGDGLSIRGGTVNLREVRITGPGQSGLAWLEGWRGRAQYLAVQAGNTTTSAIRGGNLSADPLAAPVSDPILRNVTVVGAPDVEAAPDGAAAVVLVDGTRGQLRGFLIYAQPRATSWALDVDGVATWDALLAGNLVFENSLLAGFGRLGSQDPDPEGLIYLTPDAEGQYLRDPSRNTVWVPDFERLDGILRGPFATVPDLRPEPGLTGSVGGCLPGALPDPFFEDTDFCGAIPPPSTSLGEIPWLEPGPRFDTSPAVRAELPGLLRFLVRSEQGVDIRGVAVAPNPTGAFPTGITGWDGEFVSYVDPGGNILTLSQLPVGCVDDQSFYITTGPDSGETFFGGAILSCTN